MLLHDNIMADGQAKAGAFSSRLGCEERVEYFFLYLERDARSVITNPDLHTVSKAPRRSRKSWFKTIVIGLGFALCRRIKAVRDQVEKYARDILWKYVCLAGGRVKRSLQSELKLCFSARAP